ncbi:MAG TPA: ferritin-like domain-containing protein [Azospirillaceae bacterium]|nr:ferritin-like domain-containing protein [Azospirillaceae bacterium]
MASINTFKDMYLAELAELHDAETQQAEALQRWMGVAQHDGLKKALHKHLEETQSQRDRLARLLQGHGVNPGMHKDQAISALLHESEKMKEILSSPDLTDAGLIASAQRIEHYEIAGYGTVATYASVLGLKEDQATLHDILEEEKAADGRLTALAKSAVNPDAAAA